MVGSYIVDFCCPEKMLVVELDGSGHTGRENNDQQRNKDLRQLGYRVIRVWNSDWNHNRDGVLEIIAETAKTPLPNPLPVPGRGENASPPTFMSHALFIFVPRDNPSQSPYTFFTVTVVIHHEQIDQGLKWEAFHE